MAVWSEVKTTDVFDSNRIDGEFYHPNYIKSENIVLSSKSITNLGKIGDLLIGPFGSAFHVTNYDNTSPYRYVRGKDVKPFTLLNDDNVYMPEKDYMRLIKYSLKEDDLLISVVGTLGNVAIVPENTHGIFSCKSTVFRNSRIDPYYLLGYFNCKYGQDCLLRRQRGAIQTGLNKEDLKTVPIPLFSDSEIETISTNIRKALSLSQISQSLYTQAQEMLERELGLDKLVFDRPLSYEARLSEVVGNNRWDADYYQVKYCQLDKILSAYSIKKIRHLSEPIETGIYSSIYSDSGRYYVRGTDIKNGYIGMDSLYRTNILIPKYKTVVVENDILVTRVGSIGVCGIVEHELSGSFFSDNLIRIRLLKSLASEISPLYLNLLLNTTIGQMQMVRYSRGSVQQRLNQSQLAEIPVPIIRKSIQDELGKILLNSRVAQKESQLLLEQSKRRVEELIEQAVKK